MIIVKITKNNNEIIQLAKRHREFFLKKDKAQEEFERDDEIFERLYRDFTCEDCKYCQMLKNDPEQYNLYCNNRKEKFTGLFILRGCFDPIEVEHKQFQLF